MSPISAVLSSATPSGIALAPVTRRDSRLTAYTYPRWHFALQPKADANPETEPNKDPLAMTPPFAAVAAWDGDTPVGMALMVYGDDYPESRLCSISVNKAYRRRGIGRALLAAAETQLKNLGGKKVMSLHTDGMPGRSAYEALVRAGGWEAPELHRLRLSGRADWVVSAEAEWAPVLQRLQAQGWQATPWDEMSAADKIQFDALAAAAPELMRPTDTPIFAPVSLVLRRHGEIVGWIQGVEELTANHIHYPVGYVIPALQRSSWLIAGLVAACRRQMETLGGDSICHYETAADNRAMQGFMLKRLKGRPGLLYIDQQFMVSKVLA